MKIRAVGGELFHADGQTDMSKLTVAFRNFANVPKKEKKSNNINLKEIFRRLHLTLIFNMSVMYTSNMFQPQQLQGWQNTETLDNIGTKLFELAALKEH